MALRTLVHILFAFAALDRAYAQSLTPSDEDAVRDRLAEAAQLSWELGTRAQALLELYVPSYSVLSAIPLPPPSRIPDNLASRIAPVLDIAKRTVANRSTANHGATGPQPFMKDDSAGDPAAIGVAVLLADWIGKSDADHLDYAGAAKDQINFLYQVIPKTGDGAFSHRVSEVQLWSDFVYMVPPFLAYYGVMTHDRNKLVDAYNQIRLYRNYFRDPNAGNMWKHIAMGTTIPKDDGHWSTGNAWAAAGMLRVSATMQQSEFASSLKGQQDDLSNWVKEIHSGMYQHLDDTHIFRNYADNGGTFYDAASTALLASTVYRIAVLRGDNSHIPQAEASRKAISTRAHITGDGWLMPVVDPHYFSREGSHSAEGQAFVLMMQAAWRDWVNGPLNSETAKVTGRDFQ